MAISSSFRNELAKLLRYPKMGPGELAASKDPTSSQLDANVISDSDSKSEVSVTLIANHFRSNLVI